MKFRNHNLPWDAKMPSAAMRQRHESPKRGDSTSAIRRAAGQAFDLNVHGPWCLHWPEPRRNGYKFLATPGGWRKMTWREARRPWWNWADADVARWRRPNGEHPLKDEEALILCVKYGALPIREIKYPGAGTDRSYFERYVAHSKKHDVPAWFKALPSMRGFRGKVVLCRVAGGQIAAIWGSKVKGRKRRVAATARVTKGWSVKPNATW